ncbi:hypothetical protein [Virgibacillus dokdonensis]
MSYHKYILFSVIASVISMLYLIFNQNFWWYLVMTFIIGLFLSGIFAITIVYANSVIRGSTIYITSTLIASGGVGGSLIPLIIGWEMDHFYSQVIIGTLFCVLLIMSILFILIIYKVKKINSVISVK